MNVQKSVAIVAAMLITAAGMTGIVNYGNVAARAHQGINPTTEVIHTLPTVNVYPSKEQLRELRNSRAGAGSASGAMPFYSFASSDDAGA